MWTSLAIDEFMVKNTILKIICFCYKYKSIIVKINNNNTCQDLDPYKIFILPI